MLVKTERNYQFERLMPAGNIDIDVYEAAIYYEFENHDVKILQSLI